MSLCSPSQYSDCSVLDHLWVFRELLDLNLDSPAPFGALGGRSLSLHLKVLHLVVQEQPGLRRPRDGDLGQLVRLLV